MNNECNEYIAEHLFPQMWKLWKPNVQIHVELIDQESRKHWFSQTTTT